MSDHSRAAGSLLLRGAGFAIDVMLALLALVSLGILVTGGGVVVVAGQPVSALRAANPLLALFVLLPARVALARDLPLAGFLAIERLLAGGGRLAERLHAWLSGLDEARAKAALGRLMAASAAVKLVNAWWYDGFSHGDAVELHRMTLNALRGFELEVWPLRGAFYPMAFLFPVQWLLAQAGVQDLRWLIVGARVVVVGFSLANLRLTYEVARRWGRSEALGLLAAALLALSHLHIKLGSSELPRTVASSFLMLCVLRVLTGRGAGNAIVAGAALGVGAALRLGETVFVAPFALQLAFERRFKELSVALPAAAAAAALVLGPGDLLYWPDMFFSVRNAIDFSLVQRLSSSGYQPAWEYLRIVPKATDPLLLSLVVAGALGARPRWPVLWAALPVVLLSFFQRKDERYLLPVLPFALLLAARGVFRLLAWARTRGAWRPAFAVWMLAFTALLELDGFRKRGSEDAVAVARWLASQPRLRDVAMEAGRTVTGADVYLAGRANVLDIDPQRLGERAYLFGFLKRPEAQYVVLSDAVVRRYTHAALLRAAGFVAVDLGAIGHGAWRVYRRRGGRAPMPAADSPP